MSDEKVYIDGIQYPGNFRYWRCNNGDGNTAASGSDRLPEPSWVSPLAALSCAQSNPEQPRVFPECPLSALGAP